MWKRGPSGVTRGLVWASCLALVGWKSLRRGSRVPVVWKRWTNASRHPGMVGGLLLAAAIVEVFIGALVEAFPHRCRPRVVVVGEGVAWPVVPMPRRLVRHRQAARVAVSQLDGAQRDNVARWGL